MGFVAWSLWACYASIAVAQSTVNIQISDADTNSTHISTSLLFEDINHSGDGGLYCELIQNRAFQDPANYSYAYKALGQSKISYDFESLSQVLNRSLHVTGSNPGFAATGYWGIALRAGIEYTASFYAKTNASGSSFMLSLEDQATGTKFASSKAMAVSGDTFLYPAMSKGFQRYEVNLTLQSDAPTFNNSMNIIASGTDDVYFNLISLVGNTLNGRRNGVKKEIADAVAEFQPEYLRFPGGNNLEGIWFGARWKWYETIGPLTDRPGRLGDWGYFNTDGLGLNEFFQLCVDKGIKPMLGIWAGLSLTEGPVQEWAIEPYVQEVLDELEYILGDQSTTFGKLRASHGYPDPWELGFIEIGNEDALTHDKEYAAYRFNAFYNAMVAQYPNMTYISTAGDGTSNSYGPYFGPAGTWIDSHFYGTAGDFINRFDYFDNYNHTQNPISVGEYQVAFLTGNFGTPDETVPSYPTMIGATAEALFAFAGERIGNTIQTYAYAPTLGASQAPGLVLLSYDHDIINFSTSFYVQKLLSMHLSATVYKTTGPFDPLYYVASSNGDKYYIKVANPTNETVTMNAVYSISSFTPGNASAIGIWANEPYLMNTFENSTRISPQSLPVTVSGQTVTLTVPSYGTVFVTLNNGGGTSSSSGSSTGSTSGSGSVIGPVSQSGFDNGPLLSSNSSSVRGGAMSSGSSSGSGSGSGASSLQGPATSMQTMTRSLRSVAGSSAVQQISDGQVQQPTQSAVQQISDGQVQQPTGTGSSKAF